MGKIKRMEVEERRLELARKINHRFTEIYKEERENQKDLDSPQLNKIVLMRLDLWLQNMVKEKPQETTFIKSAVRKWIETVKKVTSEATKG